MATGNDNLLQRLRKLLAEAADTSDIRQPWQELFARKDSVPPRAIRAAEAVEGFIGSWAASHVVDGQIRHVVDKTVVPKAGFDSMLGKRGYPEINFVPYNWNTNAGGTNNPALVGHPVSFEFVGPTDKALHETGVSFGANLNRNTIEMSVVPEEIFGITDRDLNTPHWVLITDPGDGLKNKIRDPKIPSYTPTTVTRGFTETKKHQGTARYELFRILQIEEKKLVLDGVKRLEDYFERWNSNKKTGNLGSIAILRPKVARLAPLNNTCTRWAVLPPERSALGEYGYGLAYYNSIGGLTEDHNLGYALPVPKPVTLRAFNGADGDEQLDGRWTPIDSWNSHFSVLVDGMPQLDLGVPPFGRFRVKNSDGIHKMLSGRQLRGEDLGVLHINQIRPTRQRTEDDSLYQHVYSVYLGFHEIVDFDEDYVECRLPVGVDVNTGRRTQWDPYFPELVRLSCSIHNTVRSLFSDVSYSTAFYDDIEATRLTGLINPNEVGRSIKVHGTNDVPLGAYSGRADRSIPNTRFNEDPGSLLDLGFRMVLFTARPSRGIESAVVNQIASSVAAPNDDGDYEINWANPINSNEIILDPEITDEQQYVDVDYASGTVSFSHKPRVGGDIVFNEDGKPILFASFVPYSMEGDQRGSAIRLTGGDLLSANLGYPVSTQHDVFSERKLGRSANYDQTISMGQDLYLVYEDRNTPYAEHWEIPETGYFQLIQKEGGTPYNDTGDLLDEYVKAYKGIEVTNHPTGITVCLKNVTWENVPSKPFSQQTITIPALTSIMFRCRPDINAAFDTSYGSNVRASTVRFAYADLKYMEDGSVTVTPTAVAGPAQELRSFFPLGENTTSPEVARFHFDAMTQRWSTNDPPWMDSGHTEPPGKEHEIGIEVSRGRLYTNWQFAADADYMRVGANVSRLGYSIGRYIAPPSEFSVDIDSADEVNNAVFECFQDLSRMVLLTGVVEGSTIASKVYENIKTDLVNQDGQTQRFLFMNKSYGDDPSRIELDGCPGNPLTWISVTLDKETPLNTLAQRLNQEWQLVAPGAPPVADLNKEGELLLTGRQIQAAPSLPYLASGELSFPITINPGTYVSSLDIRSATNHSVYETQTLQLKPAWACIELRWRVSSAETYNTPSEYAQALNERLLYNGSAEKLLKRAGFRPALINSENPGLLAANIKELPLVFVANDDKRFPSSLDGATQIALLCSGSARLDTLASESIDQDQLGWDALTAPAPSVLVELDSHGKANSVHGLLGKTPENNRFGLFWGDRSNATFPSGKHHPKGSEGDWDSVNLGALGNSAELRFDVNGTRPLGRFAGSFKISNAYFLGDSEKIRLILDLPTGQSSDWYNDQTEVSSEADLYGEKINPRVKGEYSGPSEPLPAKVKSGWLGRWQWPHYDIGDIDKPKDLGGIKQIHLSFGTKTFNENGFRTHFGGDPFSLNGSHGGQLVKISPTDESQWKRPKNVWDDFAYGDIVSGYSPKYLQPVIEGRVIEKTPKRELDDNGFPVEGDYSLFAIMGERNVETNNTAAPSVYLSQAFKSTGWTRTNMRTSVVPSPIWGSDAAVAHLVSQVNPNVEPTEVETGFFTSRPNPNATSSVLVGAGRVSMLSTLGAIEPTGIAFHNLIQDFSTTATKQIGRSSVYLESGAWTTTYPNGDERVPYWGEKNFAPSSLGSKGNTTSQYGGVGGIRVSGDAHLWVQDIKPLWSEGEATAFVVPRSPYQNISGMFDHGLIERTGSVISSNSKLVEVTVLIGMSQSDMSAFEGFINTDSAYSFGGSTAATMGNNLFPFWNFNPAPNHQQGERYFKFGQAAVASETPQLMPSLAGTYLEIGDIRFRVVASPVIQLGGTLAQLVYPGIDSGFSSGTPLYADTPFHDGDRMLPSKGRNRLSQFAGFVALRAEVVIPVTSSPPSGWNMWSFYDNRSGNDLIFSGKVVDPGGPPTGVPSSVRGLTIDPQVVAGKDRLPIEIIPLTGTTTRIGPSSQSPPDQFNFKQSADDSSQGTLTGGAHLLGVHDQIGSSGKRFSRAFFTINDRTRSELVDVIYTDAAARIVVLADESGLVDSLPNGDESSLSPIGGGRLNTYGYARRLGPGVMMDGGLGLVQATAFRATPRSSQTENLGQMTVWGRGAYPFYNGLRPADIGVELPSTFNTVEFYGEMSVASPQGRVVFESPLAAEGIVANMFTAQYASTFYIGPYHYRKKGLNTDTSYQTGVFRDSGLGLSDTLFPYVSAGVVVKTPGTTVYERAFRSLDATGSNPYRKLREGTHNRGGIPGMGVPFKGEVLLLPQGPTSMGVGFADYRGGSGKTPLDIPLYEFINGATVPQIVAKTLRPYTKIESSPFGINVSAVVNGHENMSYPNADAGPERHKGQMGTVSQAYRHSNSRENDADYGWSDSDGGKPALQVRVLDGMVLEDTTNGTFYTIGSIGRDVHRKNATTQLGVIGDSVRAPVNGSLTALGGNQYRVNAAQATWDERYLPEVLYDFTSMVDVTKDPFVEPKVGFGDRTDDGYVRRPLFGHDMRITPNVEFVPVLGPRGVRGGLLPPWYFDLSTKGKVLGLDSGIDADALFYDLDHDFKQEDVGKMLYICGTHTYEHTGWWVIIGFGASDKHVAHGLDSSTAISNYVMLRKYNWADRRVPMTTSPTPARYVPIGDGLRSSDCSGHIPLRYRAPYVTLVADKRTNMADGLGFMGVDHTGVIEDDADLTYGDFKLGFIPSEGLEKAVVYIISREELIDDGVRTLESLASFLNKDPRSNGRAYINELQNGAVSKLVQWDVKENVLIGRYEPKYLSSATLRSKVFSGAASFSVYWESRTGISGSDPFAYSDDEKSGFIACLGHSLNADRTSGDRNNAMPIPALRDASQIQNKYAFDYKETAARGLRWVFSHPLTEENVGSYIHLTKPHKYHFGLLPPSQNSGVDGRAQAVLDGGWSTAHQTLSDSQSSKGVFLTTDIFRINRCPNTGKMVIGGDCEVYFTEAHTIPEVSGDVGKGTAITYSPLGVHGVWQDTDTGELSQEHLNWPTLFELQPIAREKIVVVSPSSAKSSPMLTRGRSGTSGTPIGPQGVGPMVVSGNVAPARPEASFLMEPWQLIARPNSTKLSLPADAKHGWDVQGYDSRVLANNANVKTIEVLEIIEQLEKDIADLTTMIAQGDAEQSTLEATIEDLENTILGESSPVVQQLLKMLSALQNDLSNILESEIPGELEGASVFTDALAIRAEKTRKIADAQKAIDEMEELLSALSDEVEPTEDALAGIMKYVASLQEEENYLLEQKQGIEDEVSKRLKEKVEIQAVYDSTSGDFTDLATFLNQNETAIKELDENFDEEADWHSDDEEVQKLVAERKAILAQLTEKRTEMFQLEGLLEQKADEIANLQAELDEINPQLVEVVAAKEIALANEAATNDVLDSILARLQPKQNEVDAMVAEGWETLFEANRLAELIAVGMDASMSPGLASVREAVIDLLGNAGDDLKMMSVDWAGEESPFINDNDVNHWIQYTELLVEIKAIEEAIEVLLSSEADDVEQIASLEGRLRLTSARVDANKNRKANAEEELEFWKTYKIKKGASLPTGEEPVIADDATYSWSPAGEWWQLYQPAWDQHGPNASEPPPTLKIDLTESFTQAVGPGAGLNTPFPSRFPRGVRLNRMWVNFGVWGTPPHLKGVRTMDELPGFAPNDQLNQSKEDVLNQLYISFNLVLEIPGSQARDLVLGTQHPKGSGTAAFPFGDRAPTSSYTHPKNADEGEELRAWPGGTIVVPLYVNREAGDMMPNVMERFVTVGPEPSFNSTYVDGGNDPKYNDWSGGHYEHGFGASGSARDPNLYGSMSMNEDRLRRHWRGYKSPNFHAQLLVNSFNPVVWGGMDYSNKDHNIEANTRKGIFEETKFSRVQASVFPRQSVMSGGLRSCFTSGLVPDGSVFTAFEPQSLSAATMTGITIAHSAALMAPPTVEAGSLSNKNLEGGHSCPHAFTVALTPVGDEYIPAEEPMDPKKDLAARYGRRLETKRGLAPTVENARQFKVGNWLDRIKAKYGIAAPSGSMLPPGSRVFLEVAVGPGPAAKDQDPEAYCAAGTWVGSVKLSFDVETVDGTAWTSDVNILGDEEG